MIFVDNKGIHDPRINLAIEEYLLKQWTLRKSQCSFSILINRLSSSVKPKYD